MFASIFNQLLPLYGCISLGFIAGKWLHVERQSVASIVFHLLLPIVIFFGVLQIQITAGALLVPLLLFIIASLMCGFAFIVAGMKWKDKTRNILALSAGNANTGYFGLPVAMMVLPPKEAGIYVMALLGMTLYENSVGYYITARGQHSALESFKKIMRLPSLYAFLLALVLNLLSFHIPDVLLPFVGQARGAYSVLGMMMIGLGLATISSFRFDFLFIGFAFTIRFILWPIVILAIIYVDAHWLHLFTHSMHLSLFIVSIVPMGANSVVIATLLKAEPEKIAMAVLLSTIVALITVPIMLAWYLP